MTTQTTGTDLYEQARNRVESDEQLNAYRDLFIGYDWPNMDEHLAWVASASVEELLDWAANVNA